MSFQKFFDSIESGALREVAQHWNDARASKNIPAWRDLSPSSMRKHLPIVWSWKFDAGTNEFVGRIAGQKIESAFGTSIRGAKMRDVFSDRDYDQMFARHKRVISEAACFIGKGLVFRHLDRFDVGERIIMPLSDGDLGADGVFGATEFKTVNEILAQDVVEQTERESWFGL